MIVYKILRPAEWERLAAEGESAGAPVDLADGFIHLSTAEQVAATAEKYFAGEATLVLAAIEADRLDALRWEPSRGGALFPHLYRPLRASDIAWSLRVEGASAVPLAIARAPREAFVDPARAQFDAFKALPRDTPIEMLNLVRFRDRALYAAGHPLAAAGFSGAEAYRRYGAETRPILDRLGVTIAWRGRFEAVLIGPKDEAWDAVFVARYPGAGAFLSMVTDPAYREAVMHRQAAVLTSRLIRLAPSDPGGAFS